VRKGEAEEAMESESATVLMVEDDPDALFLLQRALRKTGLGVPLRIAVDGEQALEQLSGRGPAQGLALPCLVLLNLKLPKVSGLEILEWMRDRPRLRRIPVIIISTSGEEEDRRRAIALGARDYHVKPIDNRGLLRLARRVTTYVRLFAKHLRRHIEADVEAR
jgi:CheY-like chemotaxis protein